MDKHTMKILDNDDKFVIFYSDWCGYSISALNLLKKHNLKHKKYKIDKIKGNLNKLLEDFNKTKVMTKFNCDHTTRPIVFHKGKFIGGYNDLKQYIETNNM